MKPNRIVVIVFRERLLVLVINRRSSGLLNMSDVKAITTTRLALINWSLLLQCRSKIVKADVLRIQVFQSNYHQLNYLQTTMVSQILLKTANNLLKQQSPAKNWHLWTTCLSSYNHEHPRESQRKRKSLTVDDAHHSTCPPHQTTPSPNHHPFSSSFGSNPYAVHGQPTTHQ